MSGGPEVTIAPVIARATAAAPSYTEAAPVPLSIDLTGQLRVT